MSGPSNGLPDTASPKEALRRWPILVLAGLGALALTLLVVNLSRSWGFSPGEKLMGDDVEDVVVSAEESVYLPPDVERFGRRPGALYVYVVVRRMQSGERLEVRVEREGATSTLSRLLFAGEEALVLERLETRPGPGENLDVVRLSLGGRTEETVPSGNYTVSVYREGEGGTAEPLGRKFFVVRGWLP
ncbi:MAG: hypothetical protein ACR2HO_00495 [Rubrobacteraceae bacterium]